MSFEDLQFVDIDEDDGTFSMISNAGTVRTYNIADEIDLMKNIIESGEKGELDVFTITTTTQEQTWEDVMRHDYKEKYGEDFETWRW